MQDSEAQFFNELAQLQELMRLFRRLEKKSNPELCEKLKNKCHEKESRLKQNAILFGNIEAELKKIQQLTFQNTKKPMNGQSPHIMSQASSSSVKQSSFSGLVFDNNSIGSLPMKKQTSNSKANSGGLFFSSISLSSIQNIKSKQQNSDKVVSSNEIPHILANNEQQAQFTNEASSTINIKSKITEFLNNPTISLTSKLVIITQIIKKLESETKQDQKVIFIFGVNFPEKKVLSQLEICTLYTLPYSQLSAKSTNCQDIIKCFSENLREPLGIIIKGQTLKNIQAQHLLLLRKLSVFPLILMLKDFRSFNGTLIKINEKALIDCSPQPTKLFNDKNQFEIFDLEKFQISKKGYTVKILSNDVSNNIQQASKAFTIEQKNDFINDGQGGFSYKVPKDFLTKKHGYYQILFMNNAGQISSRKKYQSKEFEQLKAEAISCKDPCIVLIQIGIKAPIPIEFMQLVNTGTNPNNYGMVCYSQPASKFASIKVFQIKPNISNQILRAQKDRFSYEEFSKGLNTVKLVELIDKQSIAKFQCDLELQDIA